MAAAGLVTFSSVRHSANPASITGFQSTATMIDAVFSIEWIFIIYHRLNLHD
jgi:hypothetical protein